MTLLPRNMNIRCDCLQPGCPYCDSDGSRKRLQEMTLKQILENHKIKRRKLKLERILKK